MRSSIARKYSIVTPAAFDVLSLESVKAFCKIDTDADDAIIQVMMDSAVESCETITNRILAECTIRAEYECTDTSNIARYPFVDIERSPVQSISSVKIWDGTAYTDEPFIFQDDVSFPRVLFNEYASSVSRSYSYGDDVAYPVRIECVAGYAEGALPRQLLNALRAHVLFLYENRGDVPAEGMVVMPPEVEAAYRRYRCVGVY